MKKIGLIGGISWVSTLDYYKLINQGINEKLGGLNFAECIIYSLNFADIQEKTWEDAYDLLYNACDSLKKSGVDGIALCANTAHIYAEELQNNISLPIIHIGSATAIAVKEKRIKTIGLLGTIFTMELEFYREKLEENGLKVLIPQSQEARNYIQQTIKEELGRGIINPETKNNYIKIIKELVENGAEGIILGCTEIPILINQTDFTVPIFDTTKIHSKAIVDFAIPSK
jgi:aspartate racemase